MSKVVRGATKVFKKVAKVVKRVAPIILAAAAVYFTAGAALGVAGAAGGWGAAATAMTAKVGASGVLGGALTGAITQAGYGAAIGGLASAVGGGSVSKGMQGGAAVGAVTGGVMGGWAARPGAVAASTPAAGATPAATGGEFVAPAGMDGHAAELLRADTATIAGNTAQPTGGGLFSKGGWLENNQKLAGGMIQGVGQGLMGRAQAGADVDVLVRRHQLQGSNYEGLNMGAGYSQSGPTQGGQAPTERFSSNTYGSFEFQFDPKQGRIVRVPRSG